MTLELLQSFAAIKDIREYLNQPFRVGDFAVASDGNHLIAIHDPENTYQLADVNVESVTKHITRLIEDAQLKTNYRALTDIAWPEDKPCTFCHGSGMDEGECPDCDGRGWFHNGKHRYECEECKGTGNVEPQPCVICNGRGKVSGQITLDGRLFNASYLKKFSVIDGAEIALAVTPPDRHDPAHFRFNGGVGAVMPMRF